MPLISSYPNANSKGHYDAHSKLESVSEMSEGSIGINIGKGGTYCGVIKYTMMNDKYSLLFIIWLPRR